MMDDYAPPKKGVLLIAAAHLIDPNFKRSVVLLCEHGDDGTFGLILNKPLDLTLGEAVEELEEWDVPLYVGGPVQPNTVHVLHKRGDLITDAMEVAPGVFWGGDFETIKALFNTNQVMRDEFRFFLGYSGWGSGQLMDEISQDSWYQAEALADLVFSPVNDRMWSRALRTKGGDYAIIANTPEDPRMN
ncbi:MAG: YqgE/AlgH family protein [Chlorobiales bacterium]|jgi:putative transcriptional regulator|nr:YqgE/AlgH family protein [Chlorobiales bacterium]